MKISFFEHALAMLLTAVAVMVLTNPKAWVVVAIVLAGQYLMLRQRMQSKADATAAEIDKDVQRIKGAAPTPVESISARWKDMTIEEPKQ